MRFFLLFAVTVLTPVFLYAQDLNEKNEFAMKAAAAAVAPSVVKIETAGGAEIIGGPTVMAGGIRKGFGPTSGVIVSADGYIITSSFNFANKPSDVFVTIPGKATRFVAKPVATDTTRMLTLIKVDARDLPVPRVFPKSAIQVGQWSLALGRTLNPDVNDPPSISVGIISALNRIWGKAVQTDAKVSPVNYGGPLISTDGRVIGILVPASPRGDGDAAGVEWYDSGIGFAIPFEHVLTTLPRLKQGKDLRRGLMGITPESTDAYSPNVVIATVAPDSAAAKAGIKPGDRITMLDGKPVPNFTALQHILGPKYEGDTLSVKVVRGAEVHEFPALTLSGIVSAVATPFLGILPLRDDPEPGVELRGVLPKSPAEKAGLKPGDRILKLAPVVPGAPQQPPLRALSGQGRTQLAELIAPLTPGTEIRFEVKRKEGGKTESVSVTLGSIPEELPANYVPPKPASAGKALEKPKPAAGGPPGGPKPARPSEPADEKQAEDKKEEAERGLLRKTNTTLGRDYWVYVPENYSPNVSHGLLIWLHPPGRGGKDAEDMVRIWRPFLEDYHYILVGPQATSNQGWVASETDGILQDVKQVMSQYSIDSSRIVAHGMGNGGQMAYYLAFQARDLIRGVVTSGAVLSTQPKDNRPSQPLSFFIVAGDKDPAVKEIARSKPALEEKKFPVIYRQLAEFGKEYLDQKTLLEICLWMELLDKI